MNGKIIRRQYIIKILKKGELIFESDFLSLEEIDRMTSEYENKEKFLQSKGIYNSPNEVSLEIWYYPNKEKKKMGFYGYYDRKPKKISPIVYSKDRQIFNREYILDKFNSHTLDQEFVLDFIEDYINSSEMVIADLAAQIKNSLHDYSKYKPPLDKLIYNLSDGYLHYRKMYFYMINYEAYQRIRNEQLMKKEQPSPVVSSKPIDKPNKRFTSKDVRGGEQISMFSMQPSTQGIENNNKLISRQNRHDEYLEYLLEIGDIDTIMRVYGTDVLNSLGIPIVDGVERKGAK